MSLGVRKILLLLRNTKVSSDVFDWWGKTCNNQQRMQQIMSTNVGSCCIELSFPRR